MAFCLFHYRRECVNTCRRIECHGPHGIAKKAEGKTLLPAGLHVYSIQRIKFLQES